MGTVLFSIEATFKGWNFFYQITFYGTLKNSNHLFVLPEDTWRWHCRTSQGLGRSTAGRVRQLPQPKCLPDLPGLRRWGGLTLGEESSFLALPSVLEGPPSAQSNLFGRSAHVTNSYLVLLTDFLSFNAKKYLNC